MVIILLLGFRTGNRPDASAAGHDIQPRLLCQPQHHQRRGDGYTDAAPQGNAPGPAAAVISQKDRGKLIGLLLLEDAAAGCYRALKR